MGQTPSSQIGEERRRSARLLETIPLVVRGVDLLGQPFEERTSTLALSYHGCRYSSKHHLPKNTWITLEIPEREGESRRRCLRARVAWIQKPRSVRELFQIGVELETPGSVWGIASPPKDWVPSTPTELPIGRPTEVPAINRELDLPGFAPAGGVPLPAPLAGYIDRLLTAARQSAQTAGSSAALGESNPLLRELSAQLEHQAERTIEAAAARADQLIRHAVQEIDRERQESAEAFREEWRKDFGRFRKEALEQLAAKSEERQKASHADLSREWESNLKQAREVFARFEEQAEALRTEIRSTTEDATTRLEQLRREIETAETAARQHQEQQRSAAESLVAADEQMRAAWREQMQAEMGVAREQWNELLQSSLDSAGQRLVARLAESSQSTLANAEQKLAARLGEIGQPIAQTAAEARETLASVHAALEQEVTRARASLGEIEQAANRMSEYSAQLEAASQDTVNEVHRRLEGILASQTVELNRRAESLQAGAAERLSSLLESAGQQSVARAAAELEARLNSHLERAHEVLRQLASRDEQAEEALRIHRERLRQASEQNQRDAAALQAGVLAQLRNDFETARREALARWNEEIEASSVRATHGVAEEMVNVSEWHQKKAQGELEALAAATLQNAAQGLEEKSREAAQKFAGEFEQRLGQQVARSREQLEEVASEVVGQSKSRFDQAAETAAKSFGKVLENVASQARERFAASSEAAFQERAARLQAAAEETHRKLAAETEHFVSDFQARLTAETERSVTGARESFDALLVTSLDSFRAHREAQEQEWLAGLQRLGGETLSQYEERLRTAGDSWMLGSVRKLNEHGQNVIDSLSKQAEQALRDACSRVFDGLAASMRERLQNPPNAPAQLAAAVPLPVDEKPAPEKIFKP